LIALAKRGEIPAYEALVLRYQTLAFRTAYLITNDAGDAEDATQTAFIKAWSALDRFEIEPRSSRINPRFRKRAPEPVPEPSFRPWLLTIVANEARNRLRSLARHPTIELDDALDHPQSDGEDSPELVAESNERRAELAAALDQLSESDRAVITMRYFLDLSEEETANALGIPRGTVKSRLSRALQRTRNILIESPASEGMPHG
jgi:RNA polymerase sigma-70 factor (ECF subfamily)